MKTESVSAAAGSAQSVAGVIRHAERSAEVKLAVTGPVMEEQTLCVFSFL